MDEYLEIDTFGVGDYEEYEEEGIETKCTFFTTLSGLFEMCVHSKGIDIKKYIKNEIKSYNGSQTHILNNMTHSHSNVSSPSLSILDIDDNMDDEYGYLNYMEYEDLKYRLAIKYDNVTSMMKTERVVGDGDHDDVDDELEELGSFMQTNDEIDSYHLKLTNFVYDFDSNHNKQCWKYLYEFEICLQHQQNNDNDDDMMIEIIKSNLNIILPSKSIHFKDDSEWDEINIIHGNQENKEIIKKCIHFFDAKICIECSKDMEMAIESEINDMKHNSTRMNNNYSYSNLHSLSYIANVLIHDDELSQESSSHFNDAH